MASSPPESEAPKAILVAEDNPTLQRLMQFHCMRAGFEPVLVESCEEAMEAARSRPFAVIIMDCNLSDEDGLKCTRDIRELEQITGAHTPIIAITGRVMVGDRERCLAAGMDDYLAKPFTRDEFMSVLDRWTNGETACA